MKNATFTVTDDLLASKGQRFLNLIIDLIIQYVIMLSIGATIEIIADVTNNVVLHDWIASLDRMELIFFGLVIMVVYYNFTEMYFSRTFAKYFTKTLVVTKQGLRPSNNTIIIRTLCRFIPFEIFSFLGSNSRGWHDTLSDTYVVRKHPFMEIKKNFL